MVAAREPTERHTFTRVDVGLILTELAIVALLLISLATGARMQQEALATLFGGDNTIAFWLWFVALGLVIPLMLEAWELRGGRVRWALLAPVLVLAGGYILRRVALDIGLEVNWTYFATQFDPALLQRLHP